MSRNATLRLLALGLLLCWCGLFLRTESTEKSMVRALYAQPTENGWTIGLFYQFPEAAADSSEAEAWVRLGMGEGRTPKEALWAAENRLPQRADYRLCSYLLLGPQWSAAHLATLEELSQKHPELRLSARVLAAEFSRETLEEQAAENEFFPEQLLQCMKETAPDAPRLYRLCRAGGTIPVLQLSDGAVQPKEEALLLSAQGTRFLSAEEAAMAAFLQGRGKGRTIKGGEEPFAVRRSICGVQAVGESFTIDLTLQLRAGMPMPTEAQRQALQALCEETVRLCWESDVDLLSLAAFRAQRDGPSAALTTKNDCPELRAVVRYLG